MQSASASRRGCTALPTGERSAMARSFSSRAAAAERASACVAASAAAAARRPSESVAERACAIPPAEPGPRAAAGTAAEYIVTRSAARRSRRRRSPSVGKIRRRRARRKSGAGAIASAADRGRTAARGVTRWPRWPLRPSPAGARLHVRGRRDDSRVSLRQRPNHSQFLSSANSRPRFILSHASD